MKNILLLLSLIISTVAVAQKHNIVNASIALRNANKAKGDEVGVLLSEAKEYIDEAFNSESTSNDPKMWNYRAPIYLPLALKKPSWSIPSTLYSLSSSKSVKPSIAINLLFFQVSFVS